MNTRLWKVRHEVSRSYGGDGEDGIFSSREKAVKKVVSLQDHYETLHGKGGWHAINRWSMPEEDVWESDTHERIIIEPVSIDSEASYE